MSALIASDLPAQVISFSLDRQEFALDLRMMQEVVLMPALSPYPQAPEHVLGVMNFRGSIVPLMDLRRRLGMAPASFTLKTAVLVCQVEGQRWGLVVDEIADILELPVSAWDHLPDRLEDNRPSALVGIAKLENRLLYVLDGAAMVRGAPAPMAPPLTGDSAFATQAMPVWENGNPNLLTGDGPPGHGEAR